MFQAVLIIAAVLAFAIILIVLVSLSAWLLLTVIRMIRWRREVRRAQQQAWEERHDEQGRVLPPVSRGICRRCGRFFERIYFLPDGSGICEECYQAGRVVPGVKEQGV